MQVAAALDGSATFLFSARPSLLSSTCFNSLFGTVLASCFSQYSQCEQVLNAKRQLQTLTHLIVLIRASTLLQMDSLEPHETLRDRDGVLVTFDTHDALTEFRPVNLIVFHSNQLLAKGEPDPDGIQLRAMQMALEKLLDEENELDDCF
eukprot:2400740-Pleurochrysis_carterae.AAC.1